VAEITIQIEGLDRASAMLDAFPRETSKAMLRAVKRATDHAATTAVRVVSSDTGLGASKVRARIAKVNPTGSNNVQGQVRGELKRVPLIEFGARGPEPSRGKGRGVSYRLPGGGRGRHPNAFITTVGTGRHRGVFVRRNSPRLPIQELKGPSVGLVMKKHVREILSRGAVAFHDEFDRLLRLILQRKNAALSGLTPDRDFF
jgi:hypothetical protein